MTIDLNRPSPPDLERMAEELNPKTLSPEDRSHLASCIRKMGGDYKYGTVLYFIEKIEGIEHVKPSRASQRPKSDPATSNEG